MEGKCRQERPLWDLVVLTSRDEVQKLAYELQLEEISRQFSNSTLFRVFVDEPWDVKIGSGGSVLVSLHRLFDEFNESLYDKKILLMPCGGYSQRQPNGSVLGKILALVPSKYQRPFTLLEMKMEMYAFFASTMKSGVFLAANDTLEYFGLSANVQATCGDKVIFDETSGFGLVAHPSSLQVGVGHGVYVLDANTKNNIFDDDESVFKLKLLKVLQKPSIEKMRLENACFVREDQAETVWTDSAYFFGRNVMERLLTYYHSKKSTIQVEIDAYGDFLQPVGENSSLDYVESSSAEKEMKNVRRELYELLYDVPSEVLVFTRSTFYHLGTFDELLTFYCQDEEFRRRFDFCRMCCVELVDLNQNKKSMVNGCVICSRLRADSVVEERTLIEVCDFPFGVEIGDNSILSNCRTEKRHRLGSDVFASTYFLDFNGQLEFVTVFLKIDEDLKKIYAKLEDFPFFGGKLVDFLSEHHGTRRKETVFDALPNSLWNAKLFPVFPTMEASFDDAADRINGKRPHLDAGIRFYSLADCCIHRKNVGKLLEWRKKHFDSLKYEKVSK